MLNQSRQASSCGKAPAKSSQRFEVITPQFASMKMNQMIPASTSPRKIVVMSVSAIPAREAKRLRRSQLRMRTERGRRARWRWGGRTIFRIGCAGMLTIGPPP